MSHRITLYDAIAGLQVTPLDKASQINFLGDVRNILSQVRSQQLEQAITKAKKPPEANVDQNANAFFNQYLQFQKEPFEQTSKSDLRTCLDAVQALTDFANTVAAAHRISAIKKEKKQ